MRIEDSLNRIKNRIIVLAKDLNKDNEPDVLRQEPFEEGSLWFVEEIKGGRE